MYFSYKENGNAPQSNVRASLFSLLVVLFPKADVSMRQECFSRVLGDHAADPIMTDLKPNSKKKARYTLNQPLYTGAKELNETYIYFYYIDSLYMVH